MTDLNFNLDISQKGTLFQFTRLGVDPLETIVWIEFERLARLKIARHIAVQLHLHRDL